MDTVVLLSARQYNFTDDAGKSVQGVTLTYITGDVDSSGPRRGCAPMSVNAVPEVFAQLDAVPGLYDVDFRQRPGKGGRPTLTATALKLRSPLDGLLRATQQASQEGK